MNDNFNKLHDIVKSQTASFKSSFMHNAKLDLIKEYNNLPKKIEAIEAKLNENYNATKEITKTYTNEYGGIISMKLFNEATPKLRPLWKARDKYLIIIEKYKKQFELGEDVFVRNELAKVESMFDSKVFGLADRLNKKSFSPDDLNFSNISSDPKLFDVYISSCNNKVHARSIIAAANSKHMIAHFRFIITNAK